MEGGWGRRMNTEDGVWMAWMDVGGRSVYPIICSIYYLLAQKERHRLMSQYRICTFNLQTKLKKIDCFSNKLQIIGLSHS